MHALERWTRLVWTSPTIMTWNSYFTKSLGLVVILPMVLTRFEVQDIALWYLFLTIMNLQLLADAGFSPTFARVIAYATAGVGKKGLGSIMRLEEFDRGGSVDWDCISAIVASMNVVYRRLSLISVLLLVTIGTVLLAGPMAGSVSPAESWSAWAIIVLGSYIVIVGNKYSAYLQGLNKIALVRRWEAITNTGAILTSYIVLLFAPSILNLTIVHQGWMVLNVVRNRLLCQMVEEGRYAGFEGSSRMDAEVMEVVWPSAWRSGVGVVMGQAPLPISGLVYAQIGNAEVLASYLLAVNLLTSLRAFSMAPFYSKIPLLSSLRAAGREDEQMRISIRGMRWSHWIYVLGFSVMALLGETLTSLIGSNAAFPPVLLWNLLSLGLLVERFGAMHLQLYSTTNRVTWHIANGVTGVLFIALAWIMLSSLGIYSFPVAYLLSYSFFYAPYTTRLSYRLFHTNFFAMEKTVALPPLIFSVVFAMVSMYFQGSI